MTQAAQAAGVSVPTLRAWQKEPAVTHGRLPGQKPKRAPLWIRNAAWRTLCDLGSDVGVPQLRALYPQMGKRELQRFVKRFKVVERRWNVKTMHRMCWHKPGWVWTMDCSDPDAALETPYRKLFGVRDLAGSDTLAWRPVERAKAATLEPILEGLFARYGAPLVMKSDNGSEFQAEVAGCLDRHGVIPLYSPPHYPRYNGACEAGIGNLKVRTHAFACRAGHPNLWTADDLEGARLQGNEAKVWRSTGAVAMSAPGAKAPAVETGEERVYHCAEGWDPIPQSERVAFAKAVEQEELKLRKEVTDNQTDPLNEQDRAAIRRTAVSRTCVAFGLLDIRTK